MITKEEVLQNAAKHNVNPIIIEKDYVLGWVLAGISNNSALSPSWVFKGGTCLKKCYFREYRFSEDLDFTIKNEASVDPDFIRSELSKMVNWVYEESGIEVPDIIIDVFPDSNGKVIRGKLGYVGPLQQRGSYTRIKLDLTQNEIIARPPVESGIYHPYGDQNFFPYTTQAYSYEEIFAEKIRALYERARPRDLYDVINLFERKNDYGTNGTILRDIILRKFRFKGLSDLTQESKISKIQEVELIQDWDTMLSHQLGLMENASQYLVKLPNVLTWIVSHEVGEERTL